jgi:PKD repeat protein
LPASPAHEYQSAGVYNVTFTLTDGTDPTSYNVEINVTGEAGFVPISYSMAIVYPCPHCTAVTLIAEEPLVPSPAFAAGEQGVDTIWLELTAEMVGKPFTVTSTGGDPDAIISAGCTPDAAIIEGHGEGPEAGTIPEGAGCLVTWDFDTPQSIITITVG